MGKDLRGKELGVGICQRKDGLYTARFTSKTGKRKQKYFHKLQECRKWISDARFEDEHGGIETFGIVVSVAFPFLHHSISPDVFKANFIIIVARCWNAGRCFQTPVSNFEVR